MKNRLEGLLILFEKNPNDTFIIYGISLEYLSLKEYAEAEKYLKLLLENEPGYVPAYMQYAQLKEKLNQIDDAKEIYRQGIKKAKEAGDKKLAVEMEEFLNELE